MSINMKTNTKTVKMASECPVLHFNKKTWLGINPTIIVQYKANMKRLKLSED